MENDAIVIECAPDEWMDIQFKLIQDVHRILDRLEIENWCAFGGLLGYLRHRGPIPWDDDYDIGVFQSEMDRLSDNVREFELLNYKVQVHMSQAKDIHLIKVYVPGFVIKTDTKDIGSPCVDIFAFSVFERKNGLDVIKLHSDEYRARWKGAYFMPREFFPLQLIEYGPLIVPAPGEQAIHRFVNNVYPKWDEVAVIQMRNNSDKSNTLTIPMNRICDYYNRKGELIEKISNI